MNNKIDKIISDYFKEVVEGYTDLERFFKSHGFSVDDFEPTSDREFQLKRLLIDFREQLEFICAIYED